MFNEMFCISSNGQFTDFCKRDMSICEPYLHKPPVLHPSMWTFLPVVSHRQTIASKNV